MLVVVVVEEEEVVEDVNVNGDGGANAGIVVAHTVQDHNFDRVMVGGYTVDVADGVNGIGTNLWRNALVLYVEGEFVHFRIRVEEAGKGGNHRNWMEWLGGDGGGTCTVPRRTCGLSHCECDCSHTASTLVAVKLSGPCSSQSI